MVLYFEKSAGNRCRVAHTPGFSSASARRGLEELRVLLLRHAGLEPDGVLLVELLLHTAVLHELDREVHEAAVPRGRVDVFLERSGWSLRCFRARWVVWTVRCFFVRF